MMNKYAVRFRPGMGVDTAEVSAYRVEGWAHDYVFFGSADDLRAPTDIFPREVVFRIWKVPPTPPSVYPADAEPAAQE